MSWAAMSKSGRPKVGKYQDFDDSQDTRVPLHNDEAFMHGLSFTSKFIGSLEVPRPTSRVEIVSCMRRIRYEFKAKGYKKNKCTVTISVSGVKVTKYKKKRRKKKKNPDYVEPEPPLIIESPVYRIFYVSHDSLDRKIFSYIARVDANNKKTFVCAVFKAYKKSHALRIVRTIGQAFDVCCKLQQSPDAVNIPGLLPPERLKKLKGQSENEESTKDETDAPERTEISAPSPQGPLAPSDIPLIANMPKLVTFDDEFRLQVVKYAQQLYAQQQTMLLQMADEDQRTEERQLLKQFNLSPELIQWLLLKFRMPGYKSTDPSVAEGTKVNLGRHDTLRSAGLPSHPPNALRFQPRIRSRPLNITENQQMKDSSGADQSMEPVPIDQLVDTSIPEEEEGSNPFTGAAVGSDDEGAKPQTASELFEVQRAQSAQLQLLKDQLSSETAARIDSQAKVHHLLEQNKELVGHIMHLVAQVKRLKGEPDLSQSGITSPPIEVVSVDPPILPPVLPLPEPAEGLQPVDVADRAPAAAEPVSDMSLLAEVLAVSSLQAKKDDEPFMVQREENMTKGQNGERFSPFPFNPEDERASTPKNHQPDDGKFSPFQEFSPGEDTAQTEDRKFSPFQEFKPIPGEGDAVNGQQARQEKEKSVVLFELPKAPTPLSDIENDEEPLYQSDGPGYMPLGNTTDTVEA